MSASTPGPSSDWVLSALVLSLPASSFARRMRHLHAIEGALLILAVRASSWHPLHGLHIPSMPCTHAGPFKPGQLRACESRQRMQAALGKVCQMAQNQVIDRRSRSCLGALQRGVAGIGVLHEAGVDALPVCSGRRSTRRDPSAHAISVRGLPHMLPLVIIAHAHPMPACMLGSYGVSKVWRAQPTCQREERKRLGHSDPRGYQGACERYGRRGCCRRGCYEWRRHWGGCHGG